MEAFDSVAEFIDWITATIAEVNSGKQYLSSVWVNRWETLELNASRFHLPAAADELATLKRCLWPPDSAEQELIKAQLRSRLAACRVALTGEGGVAGGDKAGDEPPSSKAEPPSLEARALAMLVDHPDWTDTRIAQSLGCNRGSLYRLDKYKAARKELKAGGMASAPRGSKVDGRIEAWEAGQ